MHLFGVPLSDDALLTSFEYSVDDDTNVQIPELGPTLRESYFELPTAQPKIRFKFSVSDGAEFKLEYEFKRPRKSVPPSSSSMVATSTNEVLDSTKVPKYEMLENLPNYKNKPLRFLDQSQVTDWIDLTEASEAVDSDKSILAVSHRPTHNLSHP